MTAKATPDPRPEPLDSPPDEGLYGKYYGLRRTRDGSEVEGWYFVLREDDPHGQKALLAYAESVEAENPALAADLRRTVRDEQILQGLYDASWER
jgi:hypothetical protein